jgi:hypothetical protein
VIGNDWNLSRNLIGNGRFYTSEWREAIPGSARALACWPWRLRYREFLAALELKSCACAQRFRRGRRNTHARRVRSPDQISY